jgi:hypothetical protein
VVADRIEDLTPLLRRLSEDATSIAATTPIDEARRPGVARHRHPRSGDALVTLFKDERLSGVRSDLDEAAVMPKGRNFH